MKVYIGRFIWHHELDTELFKAIDILCVSPDLETVKNCLMKHADDHACHWLDSDVSYVIDIYDLEDTSFKSEEIHMRSNFTWTDNS